MIANVTPPPSGADKMKEYKFTFDTGGTLKSDTSNPTLYIVYYYPGASGSKQIPPGGAFNRTTIGNQFNQFTCFAGESDDAPILFAWYNTSGPFVNKNFNRKSFIGVAENGGFTVFTPTNGTSFSFYLPQS